MMAQATAAAQRELAAERRGYAPQGAIAHLWASDADELILSGPAGTGKTRGSLEYLHEQASIYPRSRWLMVRKTRASLTDSALVIYERYVLGEENPICAGMLRANRHSYRYPNGSEIVTGGMDKPTRILSTEYDGIYVPEAVELTLTDWETLISRLRGGNVPHEIIWGDTNPDVPHHWIMQRSQTGALELVYTRHEDNPVLWDAAAATWTARGAAYLAKLDKLTGTRKQRLRYGKWVIAEGAVYEDFDPAVHLVDRFDIPAEWRRFRVIDFGYTNPFVCQWWAQDHDGRLYLYRELYMTGRTVRVHAAQILALSEGERIEATVADHDAEDRATLRECGISTVAARKEISVGIQAVQERLRVAGDGQPRLFVLRDSLVERDETLAEAAQPVCTADEFAAYVWAKQADGKPNKEAPVDLYNHGMDCVRYGVRHVDGSPVARVRANPLY